MNNVSEPNWEQLLKGEISCPLGTFAVNSRAHPPMVGTVLQAVYSGVKKG